jgi:hypothetical protein
MNAAAIILVVLLITAAAIGCLRHGKSRPAYNAPVALLDLALWIFLLWQAGFFK